MPLTLRLMDLTIDEITSSTTRMIMTPMMAAPGTLAKNSPMGSFVL